MVKDKKKNCGATVTQNQVNNNEKLIKHRSKRGKGSKRVGVKVSEPSRQVGYSCLQTVAMSENSANISTMNNSNSKQSSSPTKKQNSNSENNSKENSTSSGAPQYIYYKRNGVLKKRRVVAKDKRKVIFLKHIDMKNCYPEPPHNTNSYIMDLHETGEKCPSPTEHMCELQDAELESNTSDIELNNHDGRDGDDFIELIPFSTFSVWNGDGDALFE